MLAVKKWPVASVLTAGYQIEKHSDPKHTVQDSVKMTTQRIKVMRYSDKAELSTHLVIESDCETVDVFGPRVQFLVAPQGSDAPDQINAMLSAFAEAYSTAMKPSR